LWFQLADNLHRADFWRAGNGARGKRRDKKIESSLAAGKLAANIRNDVDNVGITLDGHQLIDFHSANLRDSADVISSQIDQHDVLGALLGIGEQIGFEFSLLLGSATARPGPGDGTQLDGVAGQSNHGFR
jgi:hypothetical protein